MRQRPRLSRASVPQRSSPGSASPNRNEVPLCPLHANALRRTRALRRPAPCAGGRDRERGDPASQDGHPRLLRRHAGAVRTGAVLRAVGPPQAQRRSRKSGLGRAGPGICLSGPVDGGRVGGDRRVRRADGDRDLRARRGDDPSANPAGRTGRAPRRRCRRHPRRHARHLRRRCSRTTTGSSSSPSRERRSSPASCGSAGTCGRNGPSTAVLRHQCRPDSCPLLRATVVVASTLIEPRACDQPIGVSRRPRIPTVTAAGERLEDSERLSAEGRFRAAGNAQGEALWGLEARAARIQKRLHLPFQICFVE